MSTKHTPGPWAETGNGTGFIRGAGGAAVASVYGDDPSCEVDARMVANCRLIAAAPELLEALRFFVDRHVELVNCGDCGNWDPEGDPEVIAARAAIAKATGEEK